MTATPSTVARLTDRTRWSDLVTNSRQGSVFCRPEFLDALDRPWEAWTTGPGSGSCAAVVFRETGGTISQAPLPFTLYQGVLCAPAAQEQPPHRRVRETVEQVTRLLEGMEHLGALSFCLHPSFDDLRPMSWFHHDAPHRGRFAMDLRYSGVIPVSTAQGREGILGQSRSVRRQEYRKASARFAVDVSHDLDLLDELHDRTFRRQGLARPARQRKLLRRIAAAALQHDFGEMLVATTAEGRPASAVLFLHDERAAYYLVAANDPEFRAAGSSTLLFVEGAERAIARGVDHIDVVGMNSPGRGDFKASFGARPVPYFVVSWRTP